MRHPHRIYEIVHTEKIIMNDGLKNLRICAITDPEQFRLARLNDARPVRIERQIDGNKYEVIDHCNNLAEAQLRLPEWREYLSIDEEVDLIECVTEDVMRDCSEKVAVYEYLGVSDYVENSKTTNNNVVVSIYDCIEL